MLKIAIVEHSFDNIMNRSIVLFHLTEAAEQLNESIQILVATGTAPFIYTLF